MLKKQKKLGPSLGEFKSVKTSNEVSQPHPMKLLQKNQVNHHQTTR